ncbi:MAG: hypothetical protein IT374_07795 [Polyangiaceae bacterium]|nr:hypothetical protein [Polyangiaceae bacterium]
MSELSALFSRHASRLRRRLATRTALTGAAVGLAVGVVAALALWRAGRGPDRWAALGAGALGAGAGLVAARRRRLDDEEVALFLDQRLGTAEIVTTAIDRGGVGAGEVREHVAREAERALAAADPGRLRVRVLSPWHALAPLAALAIGYVAWMPLPPREAKAQAPGADTVMLAEVKGLEKVAELAKLHARDEEQKKRLDKIAKDAAALREKLREGTERREALAELGKLQDAVDAERLSLGDGEKRAGLEAALGRLAQDPLTKDAAKALADRDLVKFDEEMQKLANSREKTDRDRAKQILKEAAEAAKEGGAADVGKALDRQRELLEQRAARAEELRELQKALEGAMTPEQKKDLDDLLQPPGSDADAKKIAKGMGDALKKLTPEERKRLAEKLKKQLQERGEQLDPASRSRLEDMARELSTPEGQKALEEELRRMATADDKDGESERQKGLDDAQRGLGDAQKQLGGAPMPMPGPPSPGAPGGPAPKGSGDASSGTPGAPGHSEDKGTGDHTGKSADVSADELRARAKSKVNGKAPTAGITIGRTGGREGDTANTRGTGAIGEVGKAETGGIDRGEVPEEYREQVGRYFQPLRGRRRLEISACARASPCRARRSRGGDRAARGGSRRGTSPTSPTPRPARPVTAACTRARRRSAPGTGTPARGRAPS